MPAAGGAFAENQKTPPNRLWGCRFYIRPSSRDDDATHPDALQSVEYSPDGALFASIASEKNAVHVLDASTTEEVHKIDGLSGATCASFSHTGRYLSVYRKGGNFAGGTKRRTSRCGK